MPLTYLQMPTAFETFDKQILTPAAYLKRKVRRVGRFLFSFLLRVGCEERYHFQVLIEATGEVRLL